MENVSPEQAKLAAAKVRAVREAVFEVVGEQREEILKRARAKLVAQGIEVSEEELRQQPV